VRTTRDADDLWRVERDVAVLGGGIAGRAAARPSVAAGHLFQGWERPVIAHLARQVLHGGTDRHLLRATARRVNLLDPPDALQHDDQLIARAEEIARRNGVTPPGGPFRSEVLETVEPAATGVPRT
jgi:hypothetical protein